MTVSAGPPSPSHALPVSIYRVAPSPPVEGAVSQNQEKMGKVEIIMKYKKLKCSSYTQKTTTFKGDILVFFSNKLTQVCEFHTLHFTYIAKKTPLRFGITTGLLSPSPQAVSHYYSSVLYMQEEMLRSNFS